MENNISMTFDAKSENESLARVMVAAFLTGLDPTLEEINDVKTAVSEAVTNSIIHGYQEKGGKVYMECALKNIENFHEEVLLQIKITDEGVGIENIEKAREPLYTSKPELERSGMGFMFMDMFMDDVHIKSEINKGTTVIMTKKIKKNR
jgi:stage II sporulation protein AB (anti-sigma F factor)